MKARAWNEQVVIPTYGIGTPEKYPMFLEKRVYQGSSGVVYPHPVIEKILDEKEDVTWQAVYLENEYLKIMILPELGGRVQMAYDKTKQRHFIYYNQVIKPALVGLTGPWISGGIEFNWPQHHRPSTYQPVDHTIEEHSDGSVTVWCSEVERMFRTKGMAGFRLYPDKAYLEIEVRLYNRTDYPQTFMWWANPAVKVNDHYQSVFPPDVHAVFDHGKRDVSSFPIAKGTYYKVDYSPGTDISRFKNIPVPTSYMAITSNYDFVGGYEHDTRGGLLHVANHHVSPGKKQWTWGNGDFGQAWDRNLTDEDGPYIELMCGVYTDNQPDFSWLMPFEQKSFTQYFMPYRDLGMVKNANKEAMVHLSMEEGKALVKAYTTAPYPSSRIILTDGETTVLNEGVNLHPNTSYENRVQLSEGVAFEQLRVEVRTRDDRLLIDWQPEQEEEKENPEPAKPARDPAEILNNEQLYLTGLHLEQYRHATYDPREYYLEALRRDPCDSRCNNALGLWYLRRGQFGKSEDYFRKAVETFTERNPNPINGEPTFNLGLAQLFQGKDEEAYASFHKSVWNAAWADSGYFELARLNTKSGNWTAALEEVDSSLSRNLHHHKARLLKAAILRKMGRDSQAEKWITSSLAQDLFNFPLYYERALLNPGTSAAKEDVAAMKELIRGNIHNYIEFALDYCFAGLFQEANAFIQIGIEEQKDQPVYPMAYYYQAWFLAMQGKREEARHTLQLAAQATPDYCFPHQNESVVVLEWAKQENPKDPKAPYYLGNFWYHARSYEEAVSNWQLSESLDDTFPIVHRNLALAYFNKQDDPVRALQELEKAFSLDADARVLMELDQLYKRLNHSPAERLNVLEKYLPLVEQRDDLYLERASLYNLIAEHRKAYDLIMARKFHPWEGGEGKVTGQFVVSLTEMAKQAIEKGEYRQAVEWLIQAQTYPENLGEGKLAGAQENELFYWLGVAWEGLGATDKANSAWQKASSGMKEPSVAMFYNDQQPDTIFYQGLALLKMGHKQEAHQRFDKLIQFGEKHENDRVKIDYFAVSLPDLLIWDDDLDERNWQLCQYLKGLGELGKGHCLKAQDLFEEVMDHNAAHAGSTIHQKMAVQANHPA